MINNKYVLVQKIPLEDLIANLIVLYEENLDFVDIRVTIEGNQVLNMLDLIGRDEYLNPEAVEEDRIKRFRDDDIDYLEDIDQII